MYRAIFHPSNQSEYYFKGELLFTVKRKRLWLGTRNRCSIYKGDEIICEFYSSEFIFLYWKLKILYQKFDKIINLKNNGSYYNLIVDNKSISIKFASNPFKKVIGKMFIDGKCVVEIEKSEKKSDTYFDFNFYDSNGLEYYILVLFSMYSIGITDSA
ncbi:hypothetical protein L1276_000530 [Flavobacterium sp. HSC-32F16]|uniref:hypothetical protein n=1 Tax=Flavobacterium sp. HSC-32F16 TaxID=2910964 RepID=UPI0020A50DA6|nr:hypothetical protein [Flavobacterium sp. HSC-32F16]MCP2025390.1 hypothetical protein [Flavobacterium sp. HSC-32F16]